MNGSAAYKRPVKGGYSKYARSAYVGRRRANMPSASSSSKYRPRSGRYYGRKLNMPRTVSLNPFVKAVKNPFAVSSGNVRIPDETAIGTFCLTQTAQCTMVIDAGAGANGNTIGFAMRPSMMDGSGSAAYVSNLCDAFLPCCGPIGGDPSPVVAYAKWSQLSSTSDPVTGLPIKSYNWCPTSATGVGPSYYPYGVKWTTGVAGFAKQQGVRARPVAWGLRVRYSGLLNATNTVQPFGQLYFGIRRTESADSVVQQSQGPDWTDASDNADFYDTGPSTEISPSGLENNSRRGMVGNVTLQQLRAMPNGIVVATGPCGPEERQFRDVDYWTGEQRIGDFKNVKTDTTSFANPGIFDLVGGQPWFLTEKCVNCVFDVDFIVHWEVIPAAQAFTLPGTVRTASPDLMSLEAAGKHMAKTNTNMTDAGVDAGDTGGGSDGAPKPKRRLQ